VHHWIHLRQEQRESCAICANVAVWNGLALVLVLDHLDGDSSNNARDNLRLGCPHCDTQLATYKNGQLGQGSLRPQGALRQRPVVLRF